MRKGFKGFMNKVFKVVWSKSKECYVVVPEIAKNNNGKKKVLASVLAGLAVMGVGAMAGTPVHAGADYRNSAVNIQPDRVIGNYSNQTVGVNSVAVGYGNYTTNEDGTIVYGAANQALKNADLAVGNCNVASGGASTAIGVCSHSTGEASLAIGNVARATSVGAIAIGSHANVDLNNKVIESGRYSTAIGGWSSAAGENGAAYGAKASAKGDHSAAIGSNASATGAGGFAGGFHANAAGQDSVAIGTYNNSYAADTVTVGQKNNAKTMGGIAIGKNNLTDSTNDGANFGETRNENSQIAIGRDNTATHLDTIAIGRDTHATGSGATVIGARADASGDNSIAIGNSGKNSDRVTASGDNSIAIGMRSQATGEAAIAQGGSAQAQGQYGIAVGRKTNASAKEAVAIGNETEANIANGVALGDHSVTTTDKGVKGYNPSDDHTRHYTNLANNVRTATTAAVSIGNGSTLTRQLTGLAAGTADTDAVNVAQLKNVGVAVTGNTGSSDFLADGGKLNVIGEGRVSTVAAHDGAKDSKITVGFDDKGMVKAGKNVKVDEVTVNGRTTYTIHAADAAAKYDFLTNAKANGGKLDGTATPTKVESGTTVSYAAGKNLTVKQDINQSAGEQTYTYSLNKDLKEITSITNNGGPTLNFGDNNISVTGGNLDLGDQNITHLHSGGDTVDNAANIGDVIRISKANDKHIKPGEYAVDNNGKVTMTYLDGNNKDVANETAVITGIAKQDLSNINKGGETVIQNLAKKSIDMENGKNTKVSNREINGVKTFKVDVEGDLNDITSITNKAGDGKVVFGGNQTVNVAGDHNINLNAKVGDITGLTNVTLDAPDFAKKGRAATEEQLKIVNNGFNNTVGLTGNTGATELQKLNKQGGLSFGVVGANNGQYITTTAAGSNVVADLSDSAKNKLNSTVVVEGKNAARVTSNVIQNADGSTKTVYTVDVNNVKPTAASTEKVQAKADVVGSSDKNIAKVAPKASENFGDAGATYEVNVSRNDVKDAAREAITVNTSNTTNNPITVTPVQDETNHNTTYTVTFDGNKAATQIPLTYKANGQNAQTVTLDKGLNFTNGRNTTASVDAEGVVKYDLNNNIDLTPNGSLKIGDTIVNNGGLTISGGPSITKTGINAGNLNITNVKAGVNNTDAVNVQQLKDARTLVTSNDNSVTINKTESGNQITYDLHVAPGAAQSVWNVKSSGNTTADSEATAKTITDGKTVEMVAGKNLTVKQTSNNDGAKVEYALSGNLTNINTIKNEGPATFTIGGNEFKFEGGNVNMGDNNITNLKSGGDVINNAANIGDVNRISKANDKHIKPGEYGVDNNGKVTMTYVDGNNKDIPNETAVITGIAKSDLSNITKGGETVIQNIAKKSIDMEDGKNTKASNRDVNGVKTFKVDVEGDLTDVTSITNKTGDGKVSFVGNQTVNVAGDHNIALNAKAGDITGLTNVTLNSADFATKGRAATEEQLKIVNNGFNNTVGLTGNTGATDLQKLNQAGGLSFGVIGANNGQYIKTTAAGSNVAVDLSDDAKAKLNNTVEVRGKNAAKVTSVTENTADGGKKTIYTVDVDNVKPTAASTEKVQAKADVAGSSDKNIAKVTPQAGDQFGDAGATYEVNVSRNDVKDAAREAVTVNTTNTTNNPITVTPVQDETNHNTTYQVTFDGNKAATQIPLTYKANGQNAQTVTLDKGLNFTNGRNTTASVDAEGVVKYDLNNNIDLTPNGSLKIGDTIVNNGGLTISGGPSITKTGINAGNLNITNVKAGVNNTDAVNVQQLKDARTLVTSNDNSVTINKTESGNQITYDLHVAPGAAQSVWNVKSSGNTTADSEATAKTITDGKTVEMVAGKNLTVKQTSNNDGAKVEYALSDDIKVGNDGKDGKPGKDGSIGVNGKDGSSVVINGKDGSIGLNGKDGKDGLTMKAENGQPGVNGKDGITRIVYEDKTNTKHEVATLDDGLKFTGNNTDTVNNHKLNSLVKVQGEGVDKTTSATFKSAAGNINIKADGTDTLEVQLNKDLKNITTIKNDGPATLTIGGNEFKFSGGNVNMGDNNITNLKSGGDVINNAANIGDVKRISKANDLHIAPTTSDRAGETTATYAYNTADKSVTLKYNDGNGATQTGTIAKIDLSGLANQIKDGYSFSTDAKGNVVGNHAVTAVGNGKTVSYAAGDNLTIAQHIDNATGEQTYTYALSNDIKVGNDGKDGKPGVDGKIGVNGKDGSAVVINGKDGSIGLNGKDGKDGLTMKAKDGQPGVNGKDGITRIVYEDNSKNTHEVATLDDGMKYAGDDAQGADKSKVIAKKLNETMDVVGGADKSKLTDNNIGVNNVDGKLKVQLSKEVNLTPSGSLTIGDTVVNNNGLTISGGPSITKTGINAGDTFITNVKAGVNDTDAVNVQQLKKAKTEVKAGNNVTVDTTYGTDGHTIYTVNANDVALGDAVLKYSANGTNTQSVKLSQGLNFVDGNYTSASVDANGQVKYDVTIGKVKDGVDGKPGVDGKDGIATVKTVVDTINNSGWKGDVTGNTVNNHAATIIKPGTTVNFGAGKNLTVEQIVDQVTGNHTYNYALSDDIKVGHDGKDGKPGVDGKIGVNGKDGSSVVINGKDGSIGLNGKDGKDGLTMKAKDGQPGVNGKDGITRIVYEDNSKNTHEVATLDDGMKYAGDDAQGTDKSKVIAKKLNQTMDIVGGANSTKLTDNNIGVNNVDGKLKVQLAQNIDLTPAGSLTIGGTSITDNGLVINQGPSITKGGINAGNQFITNVKAGVNNTDAVNVAQLKSAKTEVEEGDNVKVTSRTGADGQTIYKVSAKAVNLGDAELKYSANGTNTQSVKLSQGLNFVDGNYTTASVDANGQVKYDVTIGKVKDGVDGKPGVDGKDGIATVKTVVDTINNSGWKANATGSVVGNSTATIVKPGNTVNYGAGKNLNVKQTVNGDEQTYEFALDKDLKELNSVQTKNIYLGNPTSHTTITYNNDNSRIEYTTKEGDKKQVANLDDIWTIQANGTDVKPVGGKVNVVGGDHIKVSTDAAGKMTISADGLGTMNGFNVKSTGNTTSDSDKTAKNITDGKTVEFSGGKNLTVKQTNTADGAKVEFALNNNIDLTPNGSVTIGDTVVNNDGLTITGGPTITKNNVDMGGQQIHNVKSGGDVDSNGANIGDIKRISKANDTRIKDGNYEVSQNGTVEMTYVDGAGKQVVDANGNPVKATISGIARQDLSNITNEGKKVITGLSSIVKGGNNVTVDTSVDNTTGQKTYTVNADLSGAKVNASVGADGSGVAKGLKNPVKVEKGTQYIAGDNMVVERKPVEGDDKIDNSITYSLAHDLTEIRSISNGGATLRINSDPGSVPGDRAPATPAFEVHGGNLSMTGNRIVNLAPGIDGTDGVNVDQLKGSRTTLTSEDHSVTLNRTDNGQGGYNYDLSVKGVNDPRVDILNEEIGLVGAQGAALSALKPMQYDPMEPTQIMAGYGNYRGNSALALGVAHYKNESTMFHGGISWAGGSSHMMANAGVTWKIGNRDSEGAVADRYRKGPISSTYAMQTEVASMKAQNAGLKGEVSDLKAENEQIKAQNAGLQNEVDQLKAQMAAMMARLGM